MEILSGELRSAFRTSEVNDVQKTDKHQKQFKSLPMESPVAHWYALIRSTDKQIDEWRKQSSRLINELPDGAHVLEVAPGPRIIRDRAGPGWGGSR